MKIGCHVANGGKLMLEGSALEAVSYGANCFMVYLGAPQNSFRKSASELRIDEMKEVLNSKKIALEDVIVHAPYIVNLAQTDPRKRAFAIDFLTREIKNVSKIGAKYYVFHPGSHIDQGVERGLELISQAILEILEHTKDLAVVLALETMAGKGSECCYDFHQIKKVLNYVNNDRLKVCFDSCHTFDAGYNITDNYQLVIKEFDEIVGLENIVVFHINDSKNSCGSRKDRHENIGFGKIGFESLVKFFDDERFSNIAKILETPYVFDGNRDLPPYKYEIEMIKRKTFDQNLIERIKRG